MKHLATIQIEFIKSARHVDKDKARRFLDYLWKAEDDLSNAKSPERRKDARKRIKVWKKRLQKMKDDDRSIRGTISKLQLQEKAK